MTSLFLELARALTPTPTMMTTTTTVTMMMMMMMTMMMSFWVEVRRSEEEWSLKNCMRMYMIIAMTMKIRIKGRAGTTLLAGTKILLSGMLETKSKIQAETKTRRLERKLKMMRRSLVPSEIQMIEIRRKQTIFPAIAAPVIQRVAPMIWLSFDIGQSRKVQMQQSK